MNKKNIDAIIINNNKWHGITITENAVKQILFLINSTEKGKGIKLGIKKSGCAGFRYTMSTLNEMNHEKHSIHKEKIFFYKNILICILYKDMPLLDGITIDFVTNNINKVFKFYNPKLDKFCGCGESFAIN